MLGESKWEHSFHRPWHRTQGTRILPGVVGNGSGKSITHQFLPYIIYWLVVYLPHSTIIFWLVVYLALWKMMEFVNGKDDIPIIPYMKWKIKAMFETTNQYIIIYRYYAKASSRLTSTDAKLAELGQQLSNILCSGNAWPLICRYCFKGHPYILWGKQRW